MKRIMALLFITSCGYEASPDELRDPHPVVPVQCSELTPADARYAPGCFDAGTVLEVER